VRRIKCDEARPACRRCTSTGRACDGYSDVPAPHSSSDDLKSIGSSPSFDSHASSQSNRSFAFFVRRTRGQLAGFFGSDFWEKSVLQAAYHEPAIRYAIVAIGAIHELFEHEMAVVNKTFALEQYHLAIRELLVPLSETGRRGVDVCLISCILFTFFEVRPTVCDISLSTYIYSCPFRICKEIMPQQASIFEAAQDYYEKPFMTSRMVGLNIKLLVQRVTLIRTPHLRFLLDCS